jgi:8-oxo-dGTP pyrophosphatase MutT (NUDIX family)
LLDCRIFDVSAAERESADGKRGTFYLIDAPDWAGVIPVVDTDEGRKFVMIRQFRHGTNHCSIEVPGGIIDDGEDPVIAVHRELLEETGYAAEMILPLGTLSPNPRHDDQSVPRLHRRELPPRPAPAGWTSTRRSSHPRPELEAIDLIGGEDMGHALMTAALFFYSRYTGRYL